jgi:undecaprenyl diphosphate synthase
MDGNRRWAKQKGWLPWYGHRHGVKAVKSIIQFCLERDISYLSLYAFSLENFRRSPEENNYLFELMAQEAQSSVEEFKSHGIRIRFIGDRSLFPESLAPILAHVEEETREGNALTVHILFCYGAQQELTAAVRAIAQQVKQGDLDPESICQKTIEEHLWLNRCPAPDIIIRTGGYKRLSNFMLYHAAYAELYFLDTLWPDITVTQLQSICDDFTALKRNFGR